VTGRRDPDRRDALALAAFILVMTIICVVAGLTGQLR
jgi:hypothetical protein